MKDNRRRFLHVFGASAATLALPACGSSDTTTETPGGEGGAGATSSVANSTAANSTAANSTAANAASSSSAASTSATSGNTTASVASSSSSSGSGSGGAGGGGGCTDPAGTTEGSPSNFAANGLYKGSTGSVLVGRDGTGLYAMTSICTHQGCDLVQQGTITAAGIQCGCHGSRYDINGQVVGGPATQSLKHFDVALGCNGSVVVDTTKTVPATTRLAV